MSRDSKYRFITIIIFILLLFPLFVYHGSLEPNPEKRIYSGEEELIENYQRYVGRNTKVTGEVVNTTPVKIEIEYGDKTKVLKVKKIDHEVSEGDRISVYGIVRKERTISAINTIVVPPIFYTYMYAVSLIGVSWIVIRIASQWRWNGTESYFEQREESLSLKQLFTGGNKDG